METWGDNGAWINFFPYVDYNREIPNVRGFFEYIHDQEMSEEMWANMKNGETPKLTIYHITGLDGFLHNSGNPNAPFVYQGVEFLNQLIPDLIDALDDDTTLILYGDHGFDDDCDHGGDLTIELATGFFAYQKNGFPMKKWYDEHPEKFDKIDRQLKNVDVASIVSLLLDTAFPFSNFGTLHPVLSPTGDIDYLHDKMVANVNQMSNYIKEYCDLRGKYWCSSMQPFQKRIEEARQKRAKSFDEKMEKVIELNEIAREFYAAVRVHFIGYRLTDSNISIWIGFYTFLIAGITCYLRFHLDPYEVPDSEYSSWRTRIIAILFCVQLFLFSVNVWFISVCIVMGIIGLSVLDNLRNFMKFKQAIQFYTLCNAEMMTIISIQATIIWYCCANSRALSERGEVFSDLNIVMLFAFIWTLQPAAARQNNWKYYAMFCICYQVIFYCDTFNVLWTVRHFDQFYHLMIDGYLTV